MRYIKLRKKQIVWLCFSHICVNSYGASQNISSWNTWVQNVSEFIPTKTAINNNFDGTLAILYNAIKMDIQRWRRNVCISTRRQKLFCFICLFIFLIKHQKIPEKYCDTIFVLIFPLKGKVLKVTIKNSNPCFQTTCR